MSTGDDRPCTTGSEDGLPSKLGTTQGEDVFILTGTTFAGTTDMNSTAGPSDTRPSTNGNIVTRPQTGLPISTIGEDGADDSAASTERHNRLLIEAEMRAEHQAAARTTMLDLAHALETSNAKAHALASQLRAEYDASASLRRHNELLQKEVDTLENAELDRQAKVLKEKALESGNKFFFNMLMEKSREAYPGELFDAAGNKSDSDGRPHTADMPLHDQNLVPTGCQSTQEMPASLGSFVSVGDKVSISWVVKLWYREVELTRARKAKEREEEERRRKLEEEQRRIAEERRKAVEEVQKIVRDLEAQLERARKVMEEHQQQQEKLEKELREAKERAAREASAAHAREEALKAELADTKQKLAETMTSLADLSLEFEAAQEALRRADEAFASERNKLQGIIRQIGSELQEAMILAKHMRETALKAKRDAAGSVSPSKFAELVAQLEGMKSQLSQYAKDCAFEKETNAWLHRKLDKNSRQLELERQFLPLLRKVRGPVGPKTKVAGENGAKRSQDATQVAVQATNMPPLGASPGKMRMSQSAGALTDNRAATAGGPLNGGRSTGFLDDQTRFASSLGFANSGQGTPIRA